VDEIMKLYHATTQENVNNILANGFRDAKGFYATSVWMKGIFLSNYPTDWNEGTKGDITITVNIPLALIADYELIEEGKPYREWYVPAEIVNRYPVRLLREDEFNRIIRRRFEPSD
jgi:hypothetical protein